MIFKFLNKNKEKTDTNAEPVNIACLLVHAAKIDENYTSDEKEIINSNENKSDKIKLLPKMLNLLGCDKESFVKVIKLMGYKVFDEKNETFFKYKPFKKIKKSLDLKIKKNNPFEALKQLNLK